MATILASAIANINTAARKQLKVFILLICSTVALVVFLDHVLNFLHSQYALVHFDLFFREGAEYDFVVFLGELILDDILRSEITLDMHKMGQL